MTMLARFELKTLASWCAARAIRWRPLSGDAMPTLLLEPEENGSRWRRMVLRVEEADLQLVTETGEQLASASELHGLLDALEGGVGDVAPLPRPALQAPLHSSEPALIL